MRKALLLIALSFVCFINGLQAQQFTQGYLDSAKAFYRDWPATQRHIATLSLFLDTAYVSAIDFAVRDIKSMHFDKRGCKVYKTKGSTVLDSLFLTKNEIKSIILRLKESASFKWTKEIIPIATIADRKDFASLYSAHLDSVKAVKMQDDFLDKCRWVFSLPAFFNGGSFSVVMYQYVFTGDGGWRLDVYKRDRGHWQFFGEITGGDM